MQASLWLAFSNISLGFGTVFKICNLVLNRDSVYLLVMCDRRAWTSS